MRRGRVGKPVVGPLDSRRRVFFDRRATMGLTVFLAFAGLGVAVILLADKLARSGPTRRRTRCGY